MLRQDAGDDRRKVLEATDIVRLIGEHLTLRPKGREHVGLCPFHDDHKPSMCVVPHKHMFHCFSCGAGGNAIDFMMKFHGMEFREALRTLADRAGIELTPFNPGARAGADGEPRPGVSRDELARANRSAWDFFRAIYRHPEHGAPARALVKRRGMSDEMVERFGVGAAPDRWDGLLKLIESKGMDAGPFVAAGLLKRRESGGGWYDTFRNRLMFPILDQIGRPIAFGGRKLREEDEPKYLNSPESALFHKGSTLYGIHAAGSAIRAQRVCVITEGYTDVIACHQHGFAHVVATLGTAFTHGHVSQVRRLCDRVILLFDGDTAGEKAAERACEVFFGEGIDVDVAMLPDGCDPDDLLKDADGRARFSEVLDRAEPALEFQVRRVRARLVERGVGAGSLAWAREVEAQVVRFAEMGLASLPPIRRQTVIKRLASVAGVDPGVVVAAVGSVRGRPQARNRGEEGRDGGAPDTAKIVPRSAHEHALACLFARPELAREFEQDARDIVEGVAYGSGPFASIARDVGSFILECGPSSEALLSMIDDPGHRESVVKMIAGVERSTEGDAERHTRMWSDCVRRVRAEAADAENGVAAGAGERHNLAKVGATLEAFRDRHKTLGGNPLARPRSTS